MTNETLIRLKSAKNENDIINSFFTKNPNNYLKMYFFCKKNGIPLQAKNDRGKEFAGTIDTIEVYFGGGESLPRIDVWINEW